MNTIIDQTLTAERSTETTLAIVNLDDCRDYLSLKVGDQIINIKLVGTYDEPWFCGRDVCTFLEYVDIKQVLRKHVRDHNKNHLVELQQKRGCRFDTLLSGAKHMEMGCRTDTLFFGATHMEKLTYNTGNVVYINEAGLYSLIMNSRTPMAEEFQDLVCGTILPSIRKTGQYSNEVRMNALMIENGVLGRANASLELRNEELEQGAEELVQKNEELEQGAEELEQKNEELEQGTKELTNTIQVVCEERAPLPVAESLRERFVLLQLDEEEEEHLYVIRGQHQYVEKRIRKLFSTNKILSTCPVTQTPSHCSPASKSTYPTMLSWVTL